MVKDKNTPQKTGPELAESGTYEVIQHRLKQHKSDLFNRLHQLNNARKNIFGTISTSLIANDHIATSHNCISADIVATGNICLFGYNVHIGLKSVINIADVFSIYEFREHRFHEIQSGIISDERFENDLQNLYKYYRNARFVKFISTVGHLYMVFKTGKDDTDIKAFKWLNEDGKLTYLNDRSAAEIKPPPQLELEWVRAQREMHREGEHPHVSILDRVFVETVGGDLTIKVEDNTDSGKGIYEEAVEHAEQSLDDGEYLYADLGNLIALKIRPYREEFRHFVYNEKMQQAKRVDALEHACILLPEDQGIIFSNGYYLQTGDFKLFDNNNTGLQFEKRISSSNGEDHLYVFYSPKGEAYVLMSYNIIEQSVQTPILCNGYTLFPSGELCYFRSERGPGKHHVVQIWQTPYSTLAAPQSQHRDTYLYKVGNKDIVRAISECREIITLLGKSDDYANLYSDLVKKTGEIVDAYYWIDKADAFQLNEPLLKIKDTAGTAIEEFEKVNHIKKDTQREIQTVEQNAKKLFDRIKRTRFESVDVFVEMLTQLRQLRGETIGLRELRYVNVEKTERLEEEIITQTGRLSNACMNFLLRPDSLKPYLQKVIETRGKAGKIKSVAQAQKVDKDANQIGAQLELLIEVVGNLKIDDATQSAKIIDEISAIFVDLNRIKADLKQRKKQLHGAEATAEFNAQIKLLDQSLINYLDISDKPQKCDEYLSKLMVQLEELEGKFADFEEFIAIIYQKREKANTAFETKRLQLSEALNRRATALQTAAERIIKGMEKRVERLKNTNEINAYFAGDHMPDKVRDIVRQLLELNDSNKADQIQNQLQTAKQQALRQLKDKKELFIDGANLIKLGNHQFNTNTLQTELTLVPRNNEMCFHITGTNFFEAVRQSDFLKTRPFWQQSLISETPQIYRAEYLAYQLYTNEKLLPQLRQSLASATVGKQPDEAKSLPNEKLLEQVRQFMANRFEEGYVKGIHDHDTTLLLNSLLQMHAGIDLLRYSPNARACALLYWHIFENDSDRQVLNHRLKAIGMIRQAFPKTKNFGDIKTELHNQIAQFITTSNLFENELAVDAGNYLFYELSRSNHFVHSPEAAELLQKFTKYLNAKKLRKRYEESLEKLRDQPNAQVQLVRTWLHAYIGQNGATPNLQAYLNESAALLLTNSFDPKNIIQVKTIEKIGGFVGEHPLIENGYYTLDYLSFARKMATYNSRHVPQYRKYVQLKKQLAKQERQQLRLETFKARTLSSFVRNRLIDKLYLPLIGSNLAKQIGVAGENKRTDLMGMLLLVSPPGYGKTTLMEYVAGRLGLVFMKINGPAIGHAVTSPDPAEAPNAAARNELHKLNLAFEMGDNIMIYLDDIQHCNPEFLQKFISLCDAQRKIEGVYKGIAKTYDFRGKKVCVVMAGNPYTESGEKFKIPDMLANRADIYNIGDIIGDTADLFKLSYIENALTSNAILARLASKSMDDVYTFIEMAEAQGEKTGDFKAKHSPEEANEYVAVLEKLLVIRDVILRVNLEYINSAAQEKAYRTEPPFKLQGSYRDMNKLAEKVQAIMNDAELQSLILSHYESEAQTLTSGAEANLLKFKEINDLLSPSETKRWAEIKATFKRNLLLGGAGEDRLGQIVGQMNAIAKGLDSYSKAFAEGMKNLKEKEGD